MKKTILAVAMAALSFGAFAHHATETVSGSNVVNSSSAAGAYASGNGASLSSAGNTQFATNSVSGSGNAGVGSSSVLKTGYTTISGAVTTGGASYAGNVSVGNATGGAEAVGYSVSQNSGTGYFVTSGGTAPAGNVSGASGAETLTHAISGRNGFALSAGTADANFDASATATRISLGSYDSKTGSTNANAGAVAAQTSFHIGNASAGALTNAAAGSLANASVGGTVFTTSTHGY